MGKSKKRKKKRRSRGGGGKKGGVMMGMHGGFKNFGRSVMGTGDKKAASKSSLGSTLVTVALVVATVAFLILKFG